MDKTDKKKTNTKTSKALIIGAIAIVVIAVTGAAIYFSSADKANPAETTGTQVKTLTIAEMKKELDAETFYQGITINGVDVSGKTVKEAAAMLEDDTSADDSKISITLSVDGKKYPIDPSVFDMESDVSTVIETAYDYNRTSKKTDESEAITERYQILEQLKVNPKDFEITYAIDPDAVDAAVHDILDPLEATASDASVTSFDVEKLAFVIGDSVTGLTIDVDGAVKDVKAALEEASSKTGEYTKVITVDTTVTKPDASKDDLSTSLGLVSSFTTETTNKDNRNTNIRLVCETIDGLVLQPGEYFNFNDFVGERTSAKGYKMATGIYGGTTRQELGGGICQTSGTLFNAVMMADLQVDERHNHTWPSDYVPIGQDATVTWGGKNFQFTNNTDYPIAIHAYYSDLHLTMEIYGRPVEDGMTIEIENDVTGRSGPGAPLYIANPGAAAGTKSTTKGAHDYISASCYKVYYKDGVEVKRELAFKSTYPSIRAEVSVGVLAPDGSICALDPSTGAVVLPAVVVPPVVETLPSETTTTEPTTTEPTTTEPTTTEPTTTETTAAETTAAETTAAETTAPPAP